MPDQPPPPHPQTALSLRHKINLIFGLISVLVLGLLVTVQIQSARTSVREEIEASNRIAAQLLGRITWLSAMGGLEQLGGFLQETGRVRANEIRLQDQTGRLIYASPPSTYKAGRDAPDWYEALVTPHLPATTIVLAGGKLTVTPNPTRSVLDAWDDLKRIVLVEALLLLVADLLVFIILGRWLAPLDRIQNGLRAIERGDHAVRLPPLGGREAGELGRTFNRMAQALEENFQVRQASADAQARLAAQREFTTLLHQRIEEERTALARELHDELGQSLTAMRSIAKSLMQQAALCDGSNQRSVQMLFDTAGSTADALHRMIPRLRPLQLDGMGVADALRDLITELQLSHPALNLAFRADDDLPALSEATDITLYRIAQEALTNVIRHAGASRATVWLRRQGSDLCLSIADDGKGAAGTLIRAGHYGVRGMQERTESLGGTLNFQPGAHGGLVVDVTIPMKDNQA
ncbi:methanol utilization control sensor protein MoxY [Oxalobacteraceae bacterium IMCC9480]|nr:methanol utilization control sensor protein MoxY [Oxalobacteraceae bacterium IMCC9480]NDP60856.1 HAMP domain-containing protein [Oxalobacteraceae bacterium]